MADEAEGKDDGLEKMIQHMTEIYPMFLKPLDEEAEEQHELNKVAYRREEDGWTCVRSVVDSEPRRTWRHETWSLDGRCGHRKVAGRDVSS